MQLGAGALFGESCMREENRNPNHQPKEKKCRNWVASSAQEKPGFAGFLQLSPTHKRSQNVKEQAWQKHNSSQQEHRHARSAAQRYHWEGPQRRQDTYHCSMECQREKRIVRDHLHDAERTNSPVPRPWKLECKQIGLAASGAVTSLGIFIFALLEPLPTGARNTAH